MNKDKKNQKIDNASSTQAHLPIAEIVNGTVIMKDGSMRMVLMVSAMNFDLKSEKEQDAITVSFQRFLNSLEFPIQVVIQSRRVNMKPYLKSLYQRKKEIDNELILEQITSYTEYLQELISLANIMTNKFYVVVPFIPPVIKKESVVAEFMQSIGRQVPKIEVTDFNNHYKELVERTSLIANSLHSVGVRAVQLNTQELIELYYNTYNPDIANQEELIKTEDIVTKKLIKKDSIQNNNKQ
ncbi:hypothetical protein ACFL14_00290 [Patescibacteria group bacterium]